MDGSCRSTGVAGSGRAGGGMLRRKSELLKIPCRFLRECHMLTILESPTRQLHFTGKEGVGQTSIAGARAVSLPDAGKRVLPVSTDPAANLDEVLQTQLGNPHSRTAVPNRFALNLDPEVSAAGYRERMTEPCRTLLPAVVGGQQAGRIPRRTLRCRGIRVGDVA